MNHTLPALTEDVLVKHIRNFFREKPFLFFGTGLSCSIDSRFGMDALRAEIVKQMNSFPMGPIQSDQWAIVIKSLQDGVDLESALDNITDPKLILQVTLIAGRFIAVIDREYGYQISSGNIRSPLSRLLVRLVETLPEGDPILHVLTPNYDMLFEYTCDYERLPYSTGYMGGIERKYNWKAAEQSMLTAERTHIHGRVRNTYNPIKHIRLYKVHGSLNYFYHRNNVITNDAWMWDPPAYAQRVMITPGLSKYEALQTFRMELLQSADAAIEKENRFLFIGYGFNDRHLEEYIKRKLITQHCNGLIVTRDSNERIEKLLSESPNLWLICKEAARTNFGTRIYNMNYSEWLTIPTRRLWDLSEFTNQVLGG